MRQIGNHREWERGGTEMDRWAITESGREVGVSETDRWAITESGREVGLSETDRQSQRVGERWEGDG